MDTDYVNGFSIGNAAGSGSKTLEQIKELIAHPLITEPLVGSVTLLPQEGKPDNVAYLGLNSINAVELYNKGGPYYAEILPEACALARRSGKRLRISIAPSNIVELIALVNLCKGAGVDIIELNASCGHRTGSHEDALYLPPLCYTSDFGHFLPAFAEMCNLQGIEGWVKVSPFIESGRLQDAAHKIRAASSLHNGSIVGIVCCNSLPLCFEGDKSGECLLDSPLGLGSMAGNILYPLMRGNLILWKELLGPTYRFIAVGGVNSGRRILECMELHAYGVQIGTPYFKDGAPALDKIYVQLRELAAA